MRAVTCVKRIPACICSQVAQTAVRRLSVQISRGLASTSSSSSSTSTSSPPLPTVALLREMRDLIDRFPLLQDTSWPYRLQKAVADVQHRRKASIAIIGERQSGVSALVSGAFDDPLASSGDTSVILASRHLGDPPEAIVLSYGEEAKVTTKYDIELPDAWLRDNNVRIVEIVHGEVSIADSSMDVLYTSDVVVILLSGERNLSSLVLNLFADLAGKHHLVIAVDTTKSSPSSRQHIIENIHEQLSNVLPSDEQPQIIFVSSEKATLAMEALRPIGTSSEPQSIDLFQKNYHESGVLAFKSSLENAVRANRVSQPSSNPISSPPPTSLQLETGSYVLSKSINAAIRVAASISDDLLNSKDDISKLEDAVNELEQTTFQRLGISDGLLQIPKSDINEAKAELEDLLEGRVVWWKLPFRVDDIVSDISLVTSHSYLRSFEDKLVYDTGRVTGLGGHLLERTDRLLSKPAFSSPPSSSPKIHALASLYSPVLLNRVAQAGRESVQAMSTSSMTASELSGAIEARRQQITAPGGPAEVLTSRAQGSVTSSASITLGSIGLGTGLQALEYTELATSVGLGLLGTVFALWRLQRSWDKAKKHFFVDVTQRVTGGLEEDLANTTEKILNRALYKPKVALSLSKELLNKRQAEFDGFRDKLATLDARTQSLLSKQGPDKATS